MRTQRRAFSHRSEQVEQVMERPRSFLQTPYRSYRGESNERYARKWQQRLCHRLLFLRARKHLLLFFFSSLAKFNKLLLSRADVGATRRIALKAFGLHAVTV